MSYKKSQKVIQAIPYENPGEPFVADKPLPVEHGAALAESNIDKKAKEVPKVPIEKKLALTPKEAAAYSNIGINRIGEMLKKHNCSFVLYVGTKKLVKRKEFEEYIGQQLEI